MLVLLWDDCIAGGSLSHCATMSVPKCANFEVTKSSLTVMGTGEANRDVLAVQVRQETGAESSLAFPHSNKKACFTGTCSVSLKLMMARNTVACPDQHPETAY